MALGLNPSDPPQEAMSVTGFAVSASVYGIYSSLMEKQISRVISLAVHELMPSML